jgi:ribosomal protein L24E
MKRSRILAAAAAVLIGVALLVAADPAPAMAATSPSWSTVPSANTSSTQDNYLNGVSCTSPTACVAVGHSFDGTHDQTLVETWDGTSWSITPSPSTSPTSDDSLAGVSCTSTTACVAVGRTYAGSQDQTLIDTWDGTSWSVTPSPDTSPTQTNVFDSVSCASATACVAAGFFAGATNNQTLVASAISVGGYRLVATDGGIFSFGTTTFYGSMGGTHLNRPVVGMAATPNGAGYWMVASDGGIFSFGNATFHGSMGGKSLNQPIVGMASTPDGRGYWLVASDGGIFAFGDATFHGSTGSLHLNQPIVGMASTPDGRGYWLVASDGGIFAFGDATFHGSMGGQSLNKPIVGMAASPLGTGYWMVASDGGIFSFGDATFHGSMGGAHLNKPIVGMAPSPVGGGYWLVASDGGIFNFGSAPYLGSTGAITLNQPVVGMAG